MTDAEVLGSLFRIRKAISLLKERNKDFYQAVELLNEHCESQKEKRITHTVEPKLPIEEPEYFSSKPKTSKPKSGSSVTAEDVLKNPLVEYKSPIGKDCEYILDKIRKKNPKTTTRTTLHRELRKQYHFRAIDEIIKELVKRGKVRIEPISYSNNKGPNTIIIKSEKIIVI